MFIVDNTSIYNIYIYDNSLILPNAECNYSRSHFKLIIASKLILTKNIISTIFCDDPIMIHILISDKISKNIYRNYELIFQISCSLFLLLFAKMYWIHGVMSLEKLPWCWLHLLTKPDNPKPLEYEQEICLMPG